jgi:AraC-like DNA-binding protein
LFDTLHSIWSNPFDERYYFNYFKNLIVQEHQNKVTTRISLGNVELITQFLEHIRQIELKLDTCIVAQIAAYLNCSERTLQRACISVFGITTQEVIKYHILLKGIYMLSRRELSISSVATQLGFSSVSSFDRCIKRFTNSTPKAIQQYLYSVGI